MVKRRSSVVVYTRWAMLRCYLDSSVPSAPARAGPASRLGASGRAQELRMHAHAWSRGDWRWLVV